jgi:hypothetical protein
MDFIVAPSVVEFPKPILTRSDRCDVTLSVEDAAIQETPLALCHL